MNGSLGQGPTKSPIVCAQVASRLCAAKATWSIPRTYGRPNTRSTGSTVLIVAFGSVWITGTGNDELYARACA
jgi:hypothetical protein